MSRELDVQMAELMGYNYWDFKGDYEGEYPMYIVMDELVIVYENNNDHRRFNPTTDIAAAWAVEERIVELGLTEEYCRELYTIALKRDIVNWRWQLIHATPEDRCRAALAAAESERREW